MAILTPDKNYSFSLVVPTTTPENVTVTHLMPDVNNIWQMTSSTRNGGNANQESVFEFSGLFNTKTRLNIATIKIEASSSNKISKKPDININDLFKRTNVDSNINVLIKQSEIEVDTNSNITSYTFDLLFSSNIEVPSGLEFILNYDEIEIPSTTLRIESINFGNSVIDIGGGTRDIKIVGKPKTPFELTLTDTNDNSVLQLTNSTKVIRTGATIRSLTGFINNNGLYSFKQKFHPVREGFTQNVITTAINGSMAASGATKIIFDSLLNVKVGDQIIMGEISSSSTITVSAINPDGDNVNECTLSSSVTADDNAVAEFVRSGTSFNLELTSTETMSDFIPTTNPTYVLYQYANPNIKLRASKTRTDYTISDGTNTSAAADTAFDKVYSGKANSFYTRTAGSKNVLSITYTLDGVSSKSFTLLKTPVFSSDSTLSSWSGVDLLGDSGNNVTISNVNAALSTSDDGHSNGICTITFNVFIEKYGTQDITLDLNLDNIVS